MCLTSPQVHGVSLTFVREVESRVIQDESDHNKTKTLTILDWDFIKYF